MNKSVAAQDRRWGMGRDALAVFGSNAVAQGIAGMASIMLVAVMTPGALGIWGVSNSTTQVLPFLAIGAPQWLYIFGTKNIHRSEDDIPMLEAAVMHHVIMASCPVIVSQFAIARWAGMEASGCIAFALAAAISQITGMQIVRLRIRGRIAESNLLFGVDRLAILMAAIAVKLLIGTVSAEIVAAAWLAGQAAALALVSLRLPRVLPVLRWPLLAFQAGLGIGVSGVAVNSVGSLARIPLAALGPETVGTFVAATYLTLPLLTVASAVDQVAFFRSGASATGESSHTWSRALWVVIGVGITASISVRIVGNWLIAWLPEGYEDVHDILGPMLAWALGTSLIGLAMKRLYAYGRMWKSAFYGGAVLAVATGAIAVTVMVTPGLRPPVQAFGGVVGAAGVALCYATWRGESEGWRRSRFALLLGAMTIVGLILS